MSENRGEKVWLEMEISWQFIMFYAFEGWMIHIEAGYEESKLGMMRVSWVWGG